MKTELVLDTGPLVALLNTADAHHGWAVEVAHRFPPPWHTTEPVLTEAAWLCRASKDATVAPLRMLQDGLLRVPLQLSAEAGAVRKLMERYRSVPMSLADASLVRLCELLSRPMVLTLDSDFLVYRRHGRRTIPLLAPFA